MKMRIFSYLLSCLHRHKMRMGHLSLSSSTTKKTQGVTLGKPEGTIRTGDSPALHPSNRLLAGVT